MPNETTEAPQSSLDFDSALKDAVVDVAQKKDSLREAEERQKPRTSRPFMIFMSVVMVMLIAWDVVLLTSRPEPLPAAALESNLEYDVAQLVTEIEAFRSSEGRLPTPMDLAPLLDEVTTYEAVYDAYVVVASDEGVRVVYDASQPLNEWLAERATGGTS